MAGNNKHISNDQPVNKHIKIPWRNRSCLLYYDNSRETMVFF